MIRLNLADVAAADRLVEALYVAAGQRPNTQQAAEWHRLAADIEAGIDALPTVHPFGKPIPLHDGAVRHQRYTEAERTAA